jgi:hypothetical protein
MARPDFALVPASPTMCSDPTFDARMEAPMTNQPRFLLARK